MVPLDPTRFSSRSYGANTDISKTKEEYFVLRLDNGHRLMAVLADFTSLTSIPSYSRNRMSFYALVF